MMIIPENDVAIFADLDDTRAAFIALGMRMPYEVAAWKDAFEIGHAGCNSKIMFEHWGNSRYHHYRFVCDDNAARHEWLMLFHRLGIEVYTSA